MSSMIGEGQGAVAAQNVAHHPVSSCPGYLEEVTSRGNPGGAGERKRGGRVAGEGACFFKKELLL